MAHPTPAALARDRLIERAKHGDRKAFLQLYDLYRALIFRYLAYELGGNIDLAQDVCEHVFLEALSGLRQLPAEVPFVSWLLGLANGDLAQLRAKNRIAA